MWLWGPSQDASFVAIKPELVKPTILAMYPPTSKIKISTNASSHGLDAVILQQSPSNNQWKPVSYASWAMTDTAKRYAK